MNILNKFMNYYVIQTSFNMNKFLTTVILQIILSIQLSAQYSTLNAHSHNDYENDLPFWLAYNNHFGSVEADIWAINGDLFVAHYEKEISPHRTLDSLYINPVVRMVRKNQGSAWKDIPGTFQLLVDLKTAVEPTLTLLVQKLLQYPDVFDPYINKKAVRIVISGNRPKPSEFSNYPRFVFFDGLLNQNYTRRQLKRVPLYSENFRTLSTWDGSGGIINKEKMRLQHVIDSVHSIKKKIRFWNSPDNMNAWKTFQMMGIDYINTDHIVELTEFLK